MASHHFDVLVVGGGISGISAGWYLQQKCPGKTYAILESRAQIGGTWDLWRYPGIRSDSDMYTFGFSFKPWNKGWNISPSEDIMSYLHETVEENGIGRHILFGHRVQRAAYSSASALWSLETSGGLFTCGFLFLCSGYYEYDGGYVPDWSGMDRFQGPILKPMHWPSDFDVKNQRVTVIGSGATAASLVPVLAETAKHVTILQRSPTFMFSMPAAEGRLTTMLRSIAPELVHSGKRAEWILHRVWTYFLCQTFPRFAARRLTDNVMKQLHPLSGKELRGHFTPHYNPWDQRIAAITDGDLFQAIKKGTVSAVTDTIKEFTHKGILLNSGTELEADVVVAATGFNMQRNFPMSDIEVVVDGKPYESSKTMIHRGMMLSDVPNLAYVMGYTNSSWTLRAELVCDRVCRLLKHMDARGYKQCCPRRDPSVAEAPGGFGQLTSGYIARARDSLPKTGQKAPWKTPVQNYILDKIDMEWAAMEESGLEFVAGPRILDKSDMRLGSLLEENSTYRGFCDLCETTVHIAKGWYHRNGHSDLCKSHFDHLQVSEQQTYRLISIASDLEAEMHGYVKACPY